MLEWFRKYFIPHLGNDHRPHFLRTQSTVVVLVMVVALELLYLLPITEIFTRSNFFAEIITGVLVDSANSDRLKQNESTLKIDPLLVQAAQLKANDMASKGYFAHVSPDGTDPWFWFARAGYKYIRAGENLAVNFNDSADLHNAWMNSPGHRANILNSNYSEIGIATAKGVYKGQEALFVVQEFGQPMPAKFGLGVSTTSAKAITPRPSPKFQPEAKPSPSPSPKVAAATAIDNVDFLSLSPSASPSSRSLPVNSGTTSQATFVEKILSEPKLVTNNLFMTMLVVVLTALALTIFVRIRIQNARLITNGLILVMIMLAVIIINQHLGSGSITANIGSVL